MGRGGGGGEAGWPGFLCSTFFLDVGGGESAATCRPPPPLRRRHLPPAAFPRAPQPTAPRPLPPSRHIWQRGGRRRRLPPPIGCRLPSHQIQRRGCRIQWKGRALSPPAAPDNERRGGRTEGGRIRWRKGGRWESGGEGAVEEGEGRSAAEVRRVEASG